MMNAIEGNLVCGKGSEVTSGENMFHFADLLRKNLPSAHHKKVFDFVALYQKTKKKRSDVKVLLDHVGYASSLMVTYSEHHKYFCESDRQKEMGKNKLSAYNTNVKLMLASLMMDIGGDDVKTLLTFLDFLHCKLFGQSSFYILEDDVGET
eukprot:10203028-Ditylum_brightwellii.AAC.1